MAKKRKIYSKEFKIKVIENYLSVRSGGIVRISKNMIFQRNI